MKKLLLLRHAKSSWGDASLADFDRPLNGRGERAAPLMGRMLRQHALHPDVVISSPAIRAKQTTQLVVNEAQISAIVQYDARIYEASPGTLLEIVSELPVQAACVLLVGHNPGLENLLFHLTGEMRHMATACLAVTRFEMDDWQQVGSLPGQLELFLKPKDIVTE